MVKNIKQTSQQDSSQIYDGLKRQTALAINCVQVGVIKDFDASSQTATVQIAMKYIKDILQDGTRVYAEYPAALKCPVVTLFGGVDFLSLPVQAGDSCLLLFNDRELDQWLYNGTGAAPNTMRLHNITDAIAIVGIRPLTNSIASFLTNGIRLSHGNGNSQIDLKTGLIESIATLFLHHGNMQVTGDLQVDDDVDVKGDTLIEGGLTVLGQTRGNAGTFTVDAHVTLTAGHTLTAPVVNSGNGATGTYNVVTVVNGIVTGGS